MATAVADIETIERTLPMKRRTLCVRLYELRLAAGLSQKEVADRSNRAFGQPHYSQWESGKKLPSVLMLEPLAHALGCDLLDLFKRPKPSSVAEATASGRLRLPPLADDDD